MRIANAKKREISEKVKKTPTMVVARDYHILQREISKWTRSKETAVLQISHLNKVLEKVSVATNFLMKAPTELVTQLGKGHNWNKYSELAYIYDMRELF